VANYNTQAVLSTGALTGVPDHVRRAFVALTDGNADALRELFYEINDGGAFRKSLAKAGILLDVDKLTSEALRERYEEASGNTVGEAGSRVSPAQMGELIRDFAGLRHG